MHFLKQPQNFHTVYAQIDAVVQILSVLKVQGEPQRIVALGALLGFLVVLGDGRAGEHEYLDGADDAALVAGVQLVGAFGVKAVEQSAHSGTAVGVVLLFQQLTQMVIGLAVCKVAACNERVDV